MISKGNAHKYVVGFVIGLSCVSAVGYATIQTEGGIGVLFNKLTSPDSNGHTTSQYRLDGTNIQDKTITSAELKDNSVTGDKIQNGSITSVDIKDGSITNADLQPGSITVNNLQENSIDASKIKNGTLIQKNVNPKWTFWRKEGNNAYYEGGNVGINTRFPNEKLQVNGSIKIKDGTEGKDYVLMSDADGKAKWSEKGVNLCKASGAGTNNLCYGTNSLQNTTQRGSDNIAIGHNLLNNTQGYSNIAIGNNALSNNRAGDQNIAIGDEALNKNINGHTNVVVGSRSLTEIKNDYYNTVVGFHALPELLSGSDNTVMGGHTLWEIKSGEGNVAIGHLAGKQTKSGNNNVYIGTNAGTHETGDNNIAIGYSTAFNNFHGSNQLNIGNIITGNMKSGEKQITIDGDLKAKAFFYTSDERLKENITPIKNVMQIVKKLRGVSFVWKENGRKTYGLIAQEVEKILPELVHTDTNGYKSVEYGNLVAFLIEGIKSQQAEIDTLKNQVSDLQKQIDEIKKTLKK